MLDESFKRKCNKSREHLITVVRQMQESPPLPIPAHKEPSCCPTGRPVKGKGLKYSVNPRRLYTARYLHVGYLSREGGGGGGGEKIDWLPTVAGFVTERSCGLCVLLGLLLLPTRPPAYIPYVYSRAGEMPSQQQSISQLNNACRGSY